MEAALISHSLHWNNGSIHPLRTQRLFFFMQSCAGVFDQPEFLCILFLQGTNFLVIFYESWAIVLRILRRLPVFTHFLSSLSHLSLIHLSFRHEQSSQTQEMNQCCVDTRQRVKPRLYIGSIDVLLPSASHNNRLFLFL